MFFVDKETFERVVCMMKAGNFDTDDIHTATAAFVLGIPSKDVTREQRNDMKKALYLYLYSRDWWKQCH